MTKKSDIVIQAEDIIKHQGKHYADQAQQIARRAMNPTSQLKPVNRAYADDGEHSVGSGHHGTIGNPNVPVGKQVG